MYKCTHFALYELVPRHVYEERGDKAWEALDDRMLRSLDYLRELYGSITVNNWYWGGNREWSCLRTPGSPYYKPYSQHSFGRSADCIFKRVTAEKVRQDILANPDTEAFQLIMSLELDVTWLHFDVRNCKRIKTYYPT